MLATDVGSKSDQRLILLPAATIRRILCNPSHSLRLLEIALPERGAERPTFVYQPIGAGPRQCIGFVPGVSEGPFGESHHDLRSPRRMKWVLYGGSSETSFSITGVSKPVESLTLER